MIHDGGKKIQTNKNVQTFAFCCFIYFSQMLAEFLTSGFKISLRSLNKCHPVSRWHAPPTFTEWNDGFETDALIPSCQTREPVSLPVFFILRPQPSCKDKCAQKIVTICINCAQGKYIGVFEPYIKSVLEPTNLQVRDRQITFFLNSYRCFSFF